MLHHYHRPGDRSCPVNREGAVCFHQQDFWPLSGPPQTDPGEFYHPGWKVESRLIVLRPFRS